MRLAMGTHGPTNAQACNDKVDRHETDDRATHKSTRASHMQVLQIPPLGVNSGVGFS